MCWIILDYSKYPFIVSQVPFLQ